MASPSGTWEGASQDVLYLRLPKSTPALPLAPAPTLPETQPDNALAVSIHVEYSPSVYSYQPLQCATTTATPPTTPRLAAREPPLDEVCSFRTESPQPSLMLFSQFGLYSFLEYDDNYGSNFVSSAITPQAPRVLMIFFAV